MSQFTANLIFYAGLIGATVVTILDWQSSKNFIYNGLTEANKLTRDRYGYFDVKKNLIFSGVMLAVVGVVGFIAVKIESPEATAFAGLMCLIPILIRGWPVLGNNAAAKRGREKQINFLRELSLYAKADASLDDLRVLFNPLLISQMGGRTYYKLFGWIYSENPDYDEAVAEIQRKIIDLSVQDESRWFPK